MTELSRVEPEVGLAGEGDKKVTGIDDTRIINRVTEQGSAIQVSARVHASLQGDKSKVGDKGKNIGVKEAIMGERFVR